MPKQTASPKATGGGGHTFESKVAAYFVSKMIAGLPPFDPADGLLTRVDFQTRADGWFLDDLLLTLEQNGASHRRAFSVKSNAQFTTKQAPADFVTACWEQFLHDGSTRFERSKDVLGIIVAPLGQRVSEALAALHKLALSQDPVDLARRIAEPKYVSHVERDLFVSFSCPASLAARHGMGSADIGRLLGRTLVTEFDFERADSARRRESDQACLEALRDPNQAAGLWEAILALVDEHRSSGGYLDRAKVLARLGRRFEFKAFPFHEADWKKIGTETGRSLATINDTIGGTLVLDRARARAGLEEALTRAPVVCLLGGSGLGKTALAKSLVQARVSGQPAIWLNAQELENADLASLEAKWRLGHPFEELLGASPGGLVVVDGIDRIYTDQGFRNAALVIQKASEFWRTLGWKTLLTSQPEEWDRVQQKLFQAQADPRSWTTTPLALPAPDEVRPVWKAFPGLQPIAARPDLHPVLLRPKVLDLLASRIALGQAPDFKNWVGESDFIAWFWESEIRKGAEGPARARFAQLLAERQAELVAHEVPADSFTVGDLKPVRGLVADRICAEPESRLAFAHDLFGDWARQSILVGRSPTLGQLAELAASSPLWHKPIRLYGLYLLESRDKSAEWVRLIQQTPEAKAPTGDIALAQELLLEAAIFAGNAEGVLARALPELLRDDGLLLKRLLECFLHVATVPDAQFMAFAQAAGLDQAQAALINRRPLWPFWLPMLRFLSAHVEQVTPAAPWALAKICEAWLRRGGTGWPLRIEAASMALRVADLFGAKDDVWSAGLHGDAEESMYRAALSGAADCPDHVIALARKLCRRVPSPTPASRSPASPKIRRVISSLYGEYDETIPPPWPDGPSDRVDSAFQRVCLTHDGLLPLIDARPAVAKEVILACLIDEPKPQGIHEYMADLHFDYGLEKPFQWFPPLFHRGPFLLFLQRQPAEALDCILRLVNFAVERWREHGESRGGEASRIMVKFGGETRTYLGGYQMLYWYRGEMGPDAVEVALMALEKYLYDQIDDGKDVAPILKTILEQSNSVATLGVAIAAGKKKPELFTGVLQPLLTVAELHEWERARTVSGEGVWQIAWGARGEPETKIAVDWHQLPHRKLSLHGIALQLFHNHEETRQLLELARKHWERRATELGSEAEDKLLNLAALFDASNWHPENSDPEQPRLEFARPKALQERNAPHLKRIEAMKLFLELPIQCRQILDRDLRIKPDGLDSFWQQLQGIEALDVPEDEEPQLKANAICAGIAVFTLKHRDWLFADAEKKRWCASQILRIIQSPPAAADHDSPVSRAGWFWDRFCAQAAPVYWADDLKAEDWRRCIALSATSCHFETVSYLFLGCLAIRERLGDQLQALEHVLLRWAAENAAWYDSCRGQDRADLVRRRDAIVADFVGGRISPRIPDWDQIAAGRKPRASKGRRGKKARQLPGFEIQLLHAAFQVLPALSAARDDAERAQWVKLWRNALGVTIRMIGEPDENGIDGTPYEYDQWVLGRVAETIAEMRDDEGPERLWEPIFSLGLGAHYWVEQFFYKWFQAGSKAESIDSSFYRRWQAMIALARRSPNWGAGPNGRVSHRREYWWQLLGLSLYSQSFWTKERRAIANAMKDLFKEWADAHLDDGEAAKLFSYFLRREATIELVPDGLVWMDAGMQRAPRHYWDEHELRPDLAEMLSHAWDRSSKAIKASPAAIKAFNRLLTELASRNEPLALQLRDQIARSQ